MSKYASVAVSGPPRRTFTYNIASDSPQLSPGQRVLVPFGRQRKVGFFLGYTQPPPGIEIKTIHRVIDPGSYFSKELFDFCLWMADYYFANPADCLTIALPPVFRKNSAPDYHWTDSGSESLPPSLRPLFKPNTKLSKSTLDKLVSSAPGMLATLLSENSVVERWPDELSSERKLLLGYRAVSSPTWDTYFKSKKKKRDAFDGVRSRALLLSEEWTEYQIRSAVRGGILEAVHAEDPLPLLDFIQPRKNLREISLNEEQQEALDVLTKSLDTGFKPFLLHGVTGSGKTIVYCHLCEAVIARGKTALVLTPEIALTSTTLAYFRGFFGDTVTVIHSAMTDNERLESWRGIRQGKYKIVVGPRSAAFAPLPDLGLIIVDEEHDGSYKQDDPAPRFNGRDSAIMRAKMNDIPVLLGSASPSIESYHNARERRYHLLKLTRRPGGATLPVVKIIDMRHDRLRGDLPYMSYSLKKAVQQRLDNDEQVIVYLNRRGHSPQLKCADCGRVAQCPNCRVYLTYHRIGGKLSCHYCGYLLNHYDTCAFCQGNNFHYLGVGTQKVEENILRLFKNAEAVRLDSDSASGRKKAYHILTQFSSRQSNLLLGTQMVTKGLDLPHVTLVGVLSADQSLDWPDFRASEKAFSRLLQVAGRSGRSENPGEVLIQTFYPEHEVIADAARQDYEGFFDREIASRKELDYPPFTRIVNFILSDIEEEKLQKESLTFRDRLMAVIEQSKLGVRVLGPTPCPMYRLRGRYRRHLFVKTRQVVRFVRSLTEWESREAHFKLPSSTRISVDVDPDNMM